MNQSKKDIEKYPTQTIKPQTACRFTIKNTKEILIGIGPTSYYSENFKNAFSDTLNKITSLRGYSLGARLAPRFYQNSTLILNRNKPIINTHCDPNKKPSSKKCINKVPFNSSSVRKPLFTPHTGPGPGAYEVTTKQNRRISFLEHFGCGKTMIKNVTINCVPSKNLTCNVCMELLDGDYWRSKNNKNVICRYCMNDEYLAVQHLYKKERDCSEIHLHEGTNAAIMLKTQRQLKRKEINEAYLSLYFTG